jgi:hypothetical protein
MMWLTGLAPRDVLRVAGQYELKPAARADAGESQQYLRDFSRVVASEQTVEGIVARRVALRARGHQETPAGLMAEGDHPTRGP